ncbi:hypothetical protein BGZ94_000226, partial [Podila epigama]
MDSQIRMDFEYSSRVLRLLKSKNRWTGKPAIYQRLTGAATTGTRGIPAAVANRQLQWYQQQQRQQQQQWYQRQQQQQQYRLYQQLMLQHLHQLEAAQCPKPMDWEPTCALDGNSAELWSELLYEGLYSIESIQAGGIVRVRRRECSSNRFKRVASSVYVNASSKSSTTITLSQAPQHTPLQPTTSALSKAPQHRPIQPAAV